MSDHDQEVKTPGTSGIMGFQIKREEAEKEEDLSRLKAADSLINIVLGEMQYIGKLMGHRKIAPVEDLEQKVKAAYDRINNHINKREKALEQGVEEPGQEAKSGPPLEKHPLLPELGGMNLEWEKMDREWMKELGVENVQDKTEMENKIKEKLQNRIKNALKMANKLQQKIRNKPAFRPVQKQVNQLVAKYKLTLEELKNKPILKPEAPEYRPKVAPPRPQGPM